MDKMENKGEGLLKNVASRVLKSTIWGFATFLMYYIAYQLFVLPILMFPQLFSFQIQPIFFTFVALAVFFAVAIQFFSGTIIQHMLGVARSLILMAFLIYALRGGILTLTENIGNETLTILVDFRLFLMMIILLSLLGLAKSIIQTINFLASDRASSSPQEI